MEIQVEAHNARHRASLSFSSRAILAFLLIGQEALVELSNKRCKRRSQGTTYLPKLKNIQPKLASLYLAHERLRRPKLLCQLDLRDPGCVSCRTQHLKNHLVLTCVDRFVHETSLALRVSRMIYSTFGYSKLEFARRAMRKRKFQPCPRHATSRYGHSYSLQSLPTSTFALVEDP